MRIDAPWLSARATRDVLGCLTGGGARAYFVGGCVRNTLMGRPVSDIDIATDARPEAVLARAAACGIKAVPTGIEHGTVTLVIDRQHFEVTTFRRDVETFGRHAVVAFSTDIAEDAARRDFTMNALYADGAGQVIDPVGGIADLRARRVRFVGEAAQRIAEDYLRILRLFRFHAWYGDPAAALDADALAACAAAQAGLGKLSRERVGSEMVKLLSAPDPAPSVAAMAEAGILARVLPDANPARLAGLVGLERLADVSPRWQRRLCVLGDAEVWAEALRLSKADRRALEATRAALEAGAPPAQAAYRFGIEPARDAVLIGAARFGVPLPGSLEAELHRGAEARFPLRSGDLDLSGPALGRALKATEERWIVADFGLDRAALLEGLREECADPFRQD
jgi:poly(A) polymerase